MIELLLAIPGGVFLFLIPGMAWCLLLFDRKEMDIFEMFALSIALSISLSTLSILFLNMWHGVKITLFNAGIILSVLTVIPVFIRMWKSGRFSIRN